MESNKRKVAALVRVSTKEQAGDDRAGIARQKESIRRTIESRQLDCVHWVEINDVSGTETFNCSEVQGILKDVETGKLDGIVLADLDRLLRPVDLEDFRILQVFQDTGAIIYSGSQEIDLSSDSGYLMGGVQALLAGHELKLIKKRMLGAKEEKRKAGKCPSPTITLPLGVTYDRKAEKYHYTDDVWRVCEAFRLIDEEGMTTLTDVAKRVGIQHRTLANQLRNRLYIGHRVYTQKRGAKYGSKNGRQCDRKKIPRTQSEIIDIKVIDIPAVSEERFNRVQAILRTKNCHWTSRRHNNDSDVHLLTGVGRCSICGDRLYCSSGKRSVGKKHSYYFCRRNYYLFKSTLGGCALPHFRQGQLDSVATDFIAEQLVDEQTIKGILDSALRGLRDDSVAKESGTSTTGSTLESLAKRRTRLLTAYENGALSLEDFKERCRLVEEEIHRVRECVGRTEASHRNHTSDEIQRLAMLIVRGAAGFKRIESLKDRKAAVNRLFSSISVGAEGITGLSLSPRFVASCTQSGSHTGKGSLPQRE